MVDYPECWEDMLSKCIDCFEIQKQARNQIVFERGEAGVNYYFILKGQISVWVLNLIKVEEESQE